MKRTIISIIIVMIIFIFMFSGCTTTTEETPITTSWTLSGTLSWTNGSSSGEPTNDVKLAVYYTGDSLTIGTSSVLVSNVINCGNDTTTDLSFTLNIDASSISPKDGEYLVLKGWEDVDGDDQWDSGETCYTADPSTDCPCFNPDGSSSSLLSCSYYYEETSNSLMGTKKGWNQAKDAAEYTPIDEATKTGAKIILGTFYTNS